MEFCEFCQQVLKIISNRTGSHYSCSRKQESFSKSALHCHLCKLVYPLIGKLGINPDDWITLIDVGSERPQPENVDNMKMCDDNGVFNKDIKFGGQSCITLRRYDDDDFDRKVRLAIWCDEGTPAAKLTSPSFSGADLITTLPPIFSNDPVEASSLISSWLQKCLSHHKKCLGRLCGSTVTPGDIVDLPTRLLHIESITPEIKVRLAKTEGKQGKYCVLSHCWGPEHKRPLQTFRHNLEKHLMNIAPDKLPKTFKDALLITKSIGIDYLWVDSLCIVQDDRDEWKRESVTMGSLYEKATLMIAAASAADSSEGCCTVQRPERQVVTVPLMDQENHILGHCYLSPMPFGERDPQRSVLNTRAWAFQEKYMSRRKVFFMPGGIMWSCRESKFDERNCGVNSNIDAYANQTWCSLLEEFTMANLTYASDRLPAIQGIATEMGGTKRHPYRGGNLYPRDVDRGQYRFGLWDNSMPTELIWMQTSQPRPNETVPDIPSWSWGRLQGKKTWCLNSVFVPSVEKAYNLLSVKDCGSLRIHGNLGMNDLTERAGCSCVEVPAPVRRWIVLTTTNASPEADIFWTPIQPPVQMILDGRNPCRILGFGCFDESPETDVFFSILASADRNEADVLRSGDDESWPMQRTCVLPSLGFDSLFSTRFRSSKPVESKTALIRGSAGTIQHGAGSGVDSPEEDTSAPIWEITLEKQYYYALLLKPIDTALTKFKRVGLGLMYKAAWDVMDGNTEFEIV
ncbi:heterokaryon incompatibility protein-domain-containing protein [Hypoxylon sp. FL0543]|nr:heterokaryon incompatibility protein-domain-containing protein [Hypoxylon sp. FL0543]